MRVLKVTAGVLRLGTMLTLPEMGRYDIDDQQRRRAVLGRFYLDGHDLEFSTAFVRAEVEPCVLPWRVGIGVGVVVAKTWRADARPILWRRADLVNRISTDLYSV